jgi:hypothetical protein
MITDKIQKCFEQLSEVQMEILDTEGIDFETKARIVNRIQDKKGEIMNILMEDDDNGQ